jgi:tetratricopeptide (TPR) repeat protein
VVFSRDGQRLASSSYDKSVKIWDVTTGQDALTLTGHTRSVQSVAFSADGGRLASASGDGTIRVWDGWRLTQDVLDEREGLALINFLFGKPLAKTDALVYIRNCKTISEAGRRKALELAECYPEEKDPERFNRAAWSIVRWPYLNVFQYQFALSQAQAACRMAPDKGSYLTTLGAAQYRLADYHDALTTLVRADQMNPDQSKSIPADLALLAMIHHRLQHKTEAAAYLTKLRQCTKEPSWAKDEEAKTLLIEVESLLQVK